MSTRAERKRLSARLAKAVHPIKISDDERARLYALAIGRRGMDGWSG